MTCGCVRELRETPFHKSHTAMRSFGGVCETPAVSYAIYMRKWSFFYWGSKIPTSGKNQNLQEVLWKENVLICHLFWKEKCFHNENEELLLYHWNPIIFSQNKKGYLETKWKVVLSVAHWQFYFILLFMVSSEKLFAVLVRQYRKTGGQTEYVCAV